MMFGVAAWLIALLWVQQSAAWFLVGSSMAPVVFGAAGLIAGFDMRWREQRLLADYQRRVYLANSQIRPRAIAP